MEDKNLNHNILMKEIIGITPKWVIRWGITMIFIFLITLVTVLASIKYPVSISMPGQLEYEKEPVPIVSKVDCQITTVDIEKNAVISRGSNLMHLRSIANDSAFTLTSPALGQLFWANNWKDQSFIKSNEPIGFIIPYDNQRILRIKLGHSKYKNLKMAQSVVANIQGANGRHISIKGYIDFIGPALSGNDHEISLKFSPALNRVLAADSFLLSANKIACNVNLTIDTTSYLNYLVHR
jgi:hypothetical protein